MRCARQRLQHGCRPRRPPSASVAGNLTRHRSTRRTWPIQTPPSPVRTSTAPWRRADDRARARRARRGRSGMGVEHRHRHPAQRRAHAGRPVGGADPAQRSCSVASDHENWRSAWRIAGRSRPITSGRPSSSGSGRNVGSAALATTSRDQLDRRVGDGPVVERALAGGPAGHRERPCRPDRAGVHLLDGLQRGDAPAGSPSLIAQSSDDGPRSPFGPGWMMIVRTGPHTSAGTRSRRNGQMIRSGSNRRDGRRDAVLVDGELDASRRGRGDAARSTPAGSGR